MKENTLVSIIMPTYNRGYIIKDAIESVRNQTYDNWELIIVDDGSTDATGDVVDIIEDDRIHYYFLSHNKGANYARNLAMSYAKGQYFCFLDTDNTWDKHFLENRIFEIQERDLDIVFGRVELVAEDILIFPSKTTKELQEQSNCMRLMFQESLMDTNTVCMKRKCYDMLGGFDENIERFQDWEYFFRIISNVEYKCGFIDNVMVKGVIQPNSIGRTKSYWSARYYLFKKYKSVYKESGALIDVLLHIFSVASIVEMSAEYRRKFMELLDYKEIMELTVKLSEYPAKELIARNHITNLNSHIANLGKIIDSKSWLLPVVQIPKNSKIIVYGFGDVGKDYCEEIARYNEYELIMAVDRDYKKYSDAFVKVGSVEDISEVEYDYILISILKEEIAMSVKDELVNSGIPENKILWFEKLKKAD